VSENLRLIQAYLEGDLSEQDVQRLEDLLSTEEGLDLFLATCHVDTLLSSRLGDRHVLRDVGAMIRSDAKQENQSSGSRIDKAVETIHWRRHPGRFVVLAAALTVVFVTAFFAIVWPRLGEEEVAQGPAEKVAPTVAQLVRVVDAQWEGEVPDPGEVLREGRQLQLKFGAGPLSRWGLGDSRRAGRVHRRGTQFWTARSRPVCKALWPKGLRRTTPAIEDESKSNGSAAGGVAWLASCGRPRPRCDFFRRLACKVNPALLSWNVLEGLPVESRTALTLRLLS